MKKIVMVSWGTVNFSCRVSPVSTNKIVYARTLLVRLGKSDHDYVEILSINKVLISENSLLIGVVSWERVCIKFARDN